MNIPSVFTDNSNFVPPDNSSKRLYERVRRRLEIGEEEQKNLIESVSKMVIRDRLVPPTEMHFHTLDDSPKLLIQYKGQDTCTIHPLALSQLAAKVNVPMTFVNHLMHSSDGNWKAKLLSHILTESFHKTDFHDRSGLPRFLHRIVGNELRGFLSRRFNRHLASAPLLRAFLVATQSVGAFPFDAMVTDVKLALRCFLPYIFEPVKNEYVCLGVEWSNSDFGAGRMQVALTMWMPARERFTVLDHTISRVHIGSVIEDADIELSDETASKEAEAQASAIKDSVSTQLSKESIEKVLKAIQLAHEEVVPWHKLRGNLARFLGRKEIDNLEGLLNQEILDLPPIPHVNGEIQPTKWWASNALSWLASKESDPEKRIELEHAAGSFIEVR